MKYTAFAIGIGSINPKIGNTKFDWNVYTDGCALYVCGSRFLYSILGTFKVGDVVELRDNDSQRKLQTLTVEKECLNQKEVINYLESIGYNMITHKPFEKFTGNKYTPRESYSIKGVKVF